MPKVARNYQHEDFSDLLAQMQQSAAKLKECSIKAADESYAVVCEKISVPVPASAFLFPEASPPNGP